MKKGNIESVIETLEANADGIKEDIKNLQHHLGIIEGQIIRLKSLTRKDEPKGKSW